MYKYNDIYIFRRSQYLDFTFPLHQRKYLVAFRQPDLNSKDIFISQFNGELWIVLFVSTIILFTSMFLINKITSVEFDHSDILCWIFCLVSQQGLHQTPATLASKILFLSGFIFGMLSFTAFTANIITTLRAPIRLNSIEELLEYDNIKILLPEFEGFHDGLKETNNEIARRIYQRHLQDEAWKEFCPTFGQRKDGFDVCDAKAANSLAFNANSTLAFVAPDNYMLSDRFVFSERRASSCDIDFFTVPAVSTAVSYGVRKDHPVKESINRATIRLYESGLMQKMNLNNRPKRPECGAEKERKEDNIFNQVNMNYVFYAYTILLFGYSTAIVLLLAEKYFCKE